MMDRFSACSSELYGKLPADESRNPFVAAVTCALLMVLVLIAKFGVDMGYDNLFVWHPILMASGFGCMSVGYVIVAWPRMHFVGGVWKKRKWAHLTAQVLAMLLMFTGVSFIWRNHAKMGKSQFGLNTPVDPVFPNLIHMYSGYAVLFLFVFVQLVGGLGRAYGGIPPLPRRSGAGVSERDPLLVKPALSASQHQPEVEQSPDGEEAENTNSPIAVARRVKSFFTERFYPFVYWNHKHFSMAIYLLSLLCILTAPFPPVWTRAPTLLVQGLALATVAGVFWARSNAKEGA